MAPSEGLEKKSEKKKSRLRRVGRRLLPFRKVSNSSPSADRLLAAPSPSSYGTLQDTERWKNSVKHRRSAIGGDDESSLPSLPSLVPESSWMFWRSDRPDLQTIATVETYLRWMILLTGSFVLGVNFSSLSTIVEKALEYSAVAWITCLLLGILLARSHHASESARGAAGSFDEEEGRSLLAVKQSVAEPDTSEHGAASSVGLASRGGLEDSVHSATADTLSTHSSPQNVHPALDPYFIVDSNKNDRVYPNASSAYKMETDYFTGEMLVMIRTPDVDDTSLDYPPANVLAVHHLRGKQRRFEFQFQVHLKKIPTGTVYFSCDLTQPFKLGMVQRAFVSAAMSFVRSSNPSFHYSIQGTTPNDEGSYERPHMAFPVQDGMNRVVATPPGEEPPKLGSVIEEDAESLKRRKKGYKIEWNLEDTYTFSLWSAYVDFLDWRVLNLPGIRPFGLNSVIGNQPIYLTLYEIDEDKDKHNRNEMTMIAEFEMSNSFAMGCAGPVAQRWMIKQKRKQISRKLLSVETNGTEETQLNPKRKTSLDIDATTDVRQQKRLSSSDIDVPAISGQPRRKQNLGRKSLSMDYELDGESGSPRNSLHSLDLDATDGDTDGNEDDGAQDLTPTNLIEEEGTLNEEAEAEAAAELGEGIYVQSGDCIILRDATDESPVPSYVTMGGGFAVLQEQTSSTIIIEKAGRSRRGKSGRSKLIKSGDTVQFKLVTKGRKGGDETRYLSIHRGWWLKWVATAPTNNGFFTVYTHETEFDATLANSEVSETQSSYLTLGGSFWLRHRRWSKFSVGVAAEGSTTYGGRMLGLYTKRKGTKSNLPEEAFISDDPNEPYNDQPEGKKTGWLKPLQLRAFEPSAMGLPAIQSTAPLEEESKSEEKPLTSPKGGNVVRFSQEDYRLDAPVWIEMMNRTDRVPQLAYVVRVHQQDAPDIAEVGTEVDSFVRIRTGRDLAEIMRVGLSWRTREVSGRRRKGSADMEGQKSPRTKSSGNLTTFASPEPTKSSDDLTSSVITIQDHGISETESGFEAHETNEETLDQFGNCSRLLEYESEDENSVEEVAECAPGDSVEEGVAGIEEENAGDKNRPSSPAKKKRFMGKLAHTVKSKTASTGKAVVRGSVKVGKGTMSAGRAIIPIRSMNPPAKEPNQKNPGRSKRQTERDLHVAVSRGMKRIERMDSRAILLDAPAILAGELAAPEQSARTVSNMLAKMSSVPRSSEFCESFNELLSSTIKHKSPQDKWFLQGGAVQLGVHPQAEEGEGPLFGATVARCLWESHWREEWCVVRAESIQFFTPNTKVPGLELLFDDIRCVRGLEARGQSPLPGYPILVVETAWMCHYVAFASNDTLDTFRQVAVRAKEYVDDRTTESDQTKDRELRKARYWQGFKSSVESSLGKGKWAEILSSGKLKPRVVLNNRRMVFDLPPKEANLNNFVEEMLMNALSLSLDSLMEQPEALVRLLDATSYLQILRLDELDFSGASCFCLFVNVYHCLLQHALLLTVNGPLKKGSCAHFMRSACYEIGGDVFSLAELLYCVVRGGLSKASHPKPPYIDVPKKSAAFRYYALGFTSARANFVLNTGDLACPKAVIVLRPEDLEQQLNVAASEYIKRNVKIDESKRIILVPKVCEVYRHDFGFEGANAAMACLQYCVGFMEDSMASRVESLLRESPPPSVKFQPLAENYHSYLRLKTFSSDDEEDE
eukprot:scaffold1878_cov170-Amphora_coffeaeformis.AAC.16